MILFIILFFYFYSQAKVVEKRTNPQVFLVGQNNSLKTKLFHWLTFKKEVESISSSSINEKTIQLDVTSVDVKDFPGYPSFRP